MTKEKCFVIMPIGELTAYPANHFKCVYEDLFCPAIEKAGYIPKRADDNKSSSLIQVNIVREVLTSPMAICDLSTRNPNVLFELGLRQAFDLPVVLVQEVGTPRIFDIGIINTIDYRKDLIYREVIEDRTKIAEAISETKSSENNINSLVKFLNIDKAEYIASEAMSSDDEIKFMLHSVIQELKSIRNNSSNMGEGSLTKNHCRKMSFEYARSKKGINELAEIAKWVRENFNNHAKMSFDDLSIRIEITGCSREKTNLIISDIEKVIEV